MKIKGPLAEMLIAIDPEMYENYMLEEDNEKVFYVQALKAFIRDTSGIFNVL
jgi:hypothetical protein